MELIQSEQNQYLKRLRQLQQRKYREAYGEFVAEGSRFVEEALLKGALVKVILVAEDHLAANAPFLAKATCPILAVKAGLLEKSLATVTPQGIAAIIEKPHWTWQPSAMTQIVIVDGVQDPGNLGTIVRTALASGTDGVVCLKGTVDLYNDKTLRATMGAIFAEPVFFCDDSARLQQELHQAGFQIAVADIDAPQDYDAMPYPAKTALVVGNEGNGPQLIRSGDLAVKIPLYNEAESLNVAVATGILLYAIKRQRD